MQAKRLLRGVFWTVLAGYFWYFNALHTSGLVGVMQDIFVGIGIVAALFYYVTFVIGLFHRHN
ncbi:hypothetical protein V1331_04650 [Levilactobacillus brevis]|uniref:hypothetical protein n=1 Tax=Levilactobacillus brevis TaxID=1580 RepID=UPI002073F7F6|nr:hypothetical protein [Levilactobacillus brevis]